MNCQPLIDAVFKHSENYSNGGVDYSVTELLNTPRIVQLKKRYGDMVGIEHISQDDEAFLDAIDANLNSFVGTAVHGYIEKLLYRVRLEDGSGPKYITEKRFFDKIYDRYISGQFDVYDPEAKTLWDCKTTTVWGMMFDREPKKKKWEEQLNIYAYLMSCTSKFKKQYPVESLKVFAFYTDWKAGDARYNPDYPQKRYEEIELNLWSLAKTKQFLEDLIKRQIDSEDLGDTELPLCSDDDCWTKNKVFAVYVKDKYGNLGKRAKKLCDSKEAAIDYMQGDSRMTIIERPAERTRCKKFCEVSPFCNQYREYLMSLE